MWEGFAEYLDTRDAEYPLPTVRDAIASCPATWAIEIDRLVKPFTKVTDEELSMLVDDFFIDQIGILVVRTINDVMAA